MSRIFNRNNVQYIQADMLKVVNANDANDVTYYKVAQ